MRKKMLITGVILILAAAWCLSAQAAWVTYHKPAGQVSAWQGFSKLRRRSRFQRHALELGKVDG